MLMIFFNEGKALSTYTKTLYGFHDRALYQGTNDYNLLISYLLGIRSLQL